MAASEARRPTRNRALDARPGIRGTPEFYIAESATREAESPPPPILDRQVPWYARPEDIAALEAWVGAFDHAGAILARAALARSWERNIAASEIAESPAAAAAFARLLDDPGVVEKATKKADQVSSTGAELRLCLGADAATMILFSRQLRAGRQIRSDAH